VSKPVTWRTKDGREIAVRDLEDAHLLNVIRFLRRRAGVIQFMEVTELAVSMAATLHGEMSLHRAEQEVEALGEQDPEEYLLENRPDYVAMLNEAKRRRLAVPEYEDSVCMCDTIVDKSDGPIYCEIHA